ncbi:hypothetical protein [Sorangium sp. So ce131]|uniref:hypothetical protein n=1 Tax=Sorangium sp. So ce131 TaxID=3133282 RepID=UPI003F60E8A6
MTLPPPSNARGRGGATTDEITFTITWEGDDDVTLFYMIDNGKVKAANASPFGGARKIEVTYQTRPFPTHRIEWSLWFPARKLRNVMATASINGGARQVLRCELEAELRWSSDGVAIS